MLFQIAFLSDADERGEAKRDHSASRTSQAVWIGTIAALRTLESVLCEAGGG